jgi:putative oxidoreductase
MSWFVLACRLVVGGVFIFASLDKLQHPAAFAQVIDHYRMVPYAVLHPFAMFLPVVEIMVGFALVLGIRQRGAALITVLLNLVFIVAIATALSRGLDISCGCFNTDGGHGVGLSLLLRDALLLIACLPPLLSGNPGPSVLDLFKSKKPH